MEQEIVSSKIKGENNGSVRRSNRSRKVLKSSWKSSDSDEDESLGKDALVESEDDQEYVGEGNEVSDESDEEFTIGKKRKAPLPTPKKSKRSKKAKPASLKSNNKASRRSSRKKSQMSYCEDSSDDDDDVYELCDGQPKVSKEKPRQQLSKKRNTSSRKPSTSAQKSKTKKTPVKKAENMDCAVTVNPQLLKTNPPSRPSRNARQARSQISYAEDSSGEDSESYEICDGQPIRRDQVENLESIKVGCTLPKSRMRAVQKKSPVKSESTSDGLGPNGNHPGSDDSENTSNADKVVLVKGQPILKSKAMSMLADDNRFFMTKNLLQDILSSEELHEPLCIWKLHGKSLQKFVQVDTSKLFESTLNSLEFDKSSEELFVPIKAIIFAEKEEKLVAEVSTCPENKEIQKAIELRAKAEKSLKTQRKKSDSIVPTAKKVNQPSTKQTKPPKKRDYMESDNSEPSERGKTKTSSAGVLKDDGQNQKSGPRTKSSTEKTAEDDLATHQTKDPAKNEKADVDELLRHFSAYLRHLFTTSVRIPYSQNLTKKDTSDVVVIENHLTTLSNQLFKGLSLNDSFLEDLKSRPVFSLGDDVAGCTCEALKDSDVQADQCLFLTGPCYDRTSLVDLEGKENVLKQYSVCSEVVDLSQAYHKLYHFKKKLLIECVSKFNQMSNTAVQRIDQEDESSSSDDKMEKKVRGTLNDVISKVERSVATSVEEVRIILNDVVKSVSDNCNADAVDKCLLDIVWVEKMFASLKGAIQDAELLIASQ